MDIEIVKTIVKKCLGYKKGEHLLIVCDDKLRDLAYNIYKITKFLNVESVLLQMAPRKMHGQEPPAAIAGALKEADAALLLTCMSLSHTKARKEASLESDTRIASLPGITEEILNRSIRIDYSALKRKAGKLSRLLTRGERLELYTEQGTRLIMSIDGRKGFSDDGLYKEKGAFGNLPAGEACIAPREGTTNGRLIVDGSMPLAGRLKRPIEIIIKDGYAQDIPIPQIRPLVKSLGRRVLNVAELGIGLNPKARVTGNVLEDEKAEKTAHVAFGNNRSFGGKVSCPCHLDFVFFNPIILVDDVRLKF